MHLSIESTEAEGGGKRPSKVGLIQFSTPKLCPLHWGSGHSLIISRMRLIGQALGGIVYTSKILLKIAHLVFGHQTEGKQMKYVLVIVQINAIKVYFQIHFSVLNVHLARKYGSQNLPQGWG